MRTGFPTVIDYVLQAAFTHKIANGVLVVVEISIHVLRDVVGIELVNLRSGALGGSRVIGDPKQGIAEAHDDPVACGRRPIERAVRFHL